MTSIAAASNSNYLTPLQQLQAELQAEVNSGAISSSDQGALSSALTDITSSLQDGNAGATNIPPGDLQSKINSLIAGEVSSGKLTTAQATELQGVFKAAFANGSGPGGAGGANAASLLGSPGQPASPPAAGGAHHGHHGHHGGSHGGDTSSTDNSSGSSNAGSANDILQQFLKSLQQSQSSTSSSSYSSSGTPDSGNASATSTSALLIDYQT
jgi:hypothetical protein